LRIARFRWRLRGEAAHVVAAFVMVQTGLNWLVDNYPWAISKGVYANNLTDSDPDQCRLTQRTSDKAH
jgi:hypothetical protein